ncbi:putative beta-lactamase hydrolase-like protein [Podospora conica]|nr:putative beta-lactamase hydrolase-like protein [Schizothecium conicum]
MDALQAKSCIANALRCQIPPSLLVAPLTTLSAFRRNEHVKLPSATSPPRRWIHQTGRMAPPQRPSRRCIPGNMPPRPLIQPFAPVHSGSGWRGHATASPEYHSSVQPTIHPIFETRTGTFQYVVADPETKNAAIIDPVLDYDKCTHTITTTSADALLSLIAEKGYTVVRIMETHAHADHLTASFYLQRRLTELQGQKPPVSIGKRIGRVQSLFGERYGIDAAEYEGVFDELLEDDQQFDIGKVRAQAIHLPGHTPDHMGYRIGDNVFCGDSLFHTDIGTARCDFPGGSAHDLYKSAKKILSLPSHVKIWTGHDYPPEGEREAVPAVTVDTHRKENRHVKDDMTEDEFVALRSERDAHLAAPRLIHESLQVNVRGGRLPKENDAGMRLLKLPLKVKSPVL